MIMHSRGESAPGPAPRPARRWHPAGWILGIALILGGCAGQQLYRDGMAMLEQGKAVEGIAKLEEARRLDPNNVQIRMELSRAREQAAQRLIGIANIELGAERYDNAEAGYRQAMQVDPGSRRALSGLEAVGAARRHETLLKEAQALHAKADFAGAALRLKSIFLENANHGRALQLQRLVNDELAKRAAAVPTLGAAFRKPVTLQFRDANLRMVFESISRTSGLNILLDKDVRADLKTSIFVKDTSVEDTIDMLLAQNQLEKKVMSENTIFVYPNQAAKNREYQELKVRSFHLAYADSKLMLAMVKGILKTKDVYINEKTNSLVMRDTAEAIKLAEKLIADQDVPEPEVILEVEILQIDRSRISDLGIRFPDTLTATLTTITEAGVADTGNLRALAAINKRALSLLPIPSVHAKLNESDVRVLANPRIRVRNHEKAKIHVGRRLPVVTSALVPAGTTTISSSSVQYLEVGLKLDVEPTIHPDGEIGIKLSMEDTSAGAAIDTGNGGRVYEVSTRNASTILRLKDGETQVLAGLISDSSSLTVDKVPGLGDIPVLGGLFGEHNTSKIRNEVVMSITPRLVGRTAVPDAGNLEYWSGTEATLRNAPQVLRQVGSASVSSSGGTAAAPPAAGGAGGTAIPRNVGPRVPPSVLPRPPLPGAAPDGAVPSDNPSAPAPAPAAPAPAPGTPETPATPGAALAPPLTLSWQGPSQAKVGQIITLTLNGRVPPEATQMNLRVAVDSAVLKPVDASEGGVFRQGASGATFTPSVDAGSGQVGLEFQRAAAATGIAAANGTLATMRFEVLGESRSTPVRVEQVNSSGAAGDVQSAPVAPLNLTLTL